MAEAPVLLETRAGMARVTLNRPQSLNAGSPDLLEALLGAFAAIERDPEARAVVLTGAGRGFCAGADLATPPAASAEATRGQAVATVLDVLWNRAVREITRFPKPTVAMVNGPAVGAGVGLALACDVVLAARSAYFAQVFVPKLALIPDAGCTWQLPQRIGRARARALVLLGDRLPAETAAEWGLIWRVVDDAALVTETEAVAERLAALSQPAVAAAKRLLDAAATSSLEEQLLLERDAQKELAERPDMVEGVRAFLEKRAPNFRPTRT
jgi:2-(1,2-epoxy-1,2-dihydrophenyl)acetyl-CoA isomerase